MTGDDQIPPCGSYILYDRVIGPLAPGTYKLTIDQSVNVNANYGTEAFSATSDRIFEVTGPRWAVEGKDVHSVYPPRNDPDAPTECYIPFITLKRKTLPWERSIFTSPTQTSNNIRSYPWLALLIFTEEELTDANGVLGIHKDQQRLKLVSDKTIDGVTYSGIFADNINTRVALHLNDGSQDDVEVDAVRIDTGILQSIAPTVDELRLLSHVRRVNPSDKENCGDDDDGWFSVVMSNRVLSKSKNYHACLVSLEGRHNEGILPVNVPLNYSNPTATTSTGSTLSVLLNTLLAVPNLPFFGGSKNSGKSGKGSSNGPSNTVAPGKHDNTVTAPSETKLVLLHHWTFSTSNVDGDFQSRMEGLRVRVSSDELPNLSRGDLISMAEVFGDVHGPKTQENVEPLLLGTDSVPGMTSNSYLRTEMVGADGISDEVLYRGPLTALPENHRPKENPYSVSDEALGLIEELGIWDISHATAFELGRLLALQDTVFTSSMHQWIAESRKQMLDEERVERLQQNALDVESMAEIISKIDISRIARTVRMNPSNTRQNGGDSSNAKR